MTENKTKLPKGLHVLFADDEESLQELIRFELPRMGHTVTVCLTGKRHWLRCNRITTTA